MSLLWASFCSSGRYYAGQGVGVGGGWGRCHHWFRSSADHACYSVNLADGAIAVQTLWTNHDCGGWQGTHRNVTG